MAAAKQKFTRAAESVLKNDAEGALLARLALAEIEDVRAELRKLGEEGEAKR